MVGKRWSTDTLMDAQEQMFSDVTLRAPAHSKASTPHFSPGTREQAQDSCSW